MAQNDSSFMLTPERLTERDIVFRDLSLQSTKVISATRSLEEADQMPFSIWVATAEDIQRNGFITLGDVLRAAPGIRVSQPGNALEGETFLMRGLAGNQFVKILINDIPIKPYAAPGMPIGAQLPIRQAERIEVIYGPAGVLYGNEACAGVVNIILKESERPVYAQADLSFGRFGRNNLDVTFGGKLGRDKKIFRFSLYGSNTVRDRTDVYSDGSLFNTDTYVPSYQPSSIYINNPNYRPSIAVNLPKTSPLPHESRLFGVNLKWRGLQFSYLRMARFDHNALGMNPLAVSYANPSDRLAENQEVYTLSFQKQRRRWITYNNISVLHYKINNTSTTTYVYDRLAASSYLIKAPTFSSPGLTDSIFNWYNSNERYGYARSFDIRYETRLNASLSPNLSIDLGAQLNFDNGIGYFGHHLTPIESNLLAFEVNSFPLSPLGYARAGANMLSQLKWQSKSLTIIGGLALNAYLGDVIAGRTLPRLAAQYRIAKKWVVRGNYSEGLRQLSPYYSTNTHIVYPQSARLGLTSFSVLDYAEFSKAVEAALRYEESDFRVEGIFFRQQTSNLLRPNQIKLTENNEWLYGYQNIPGKGIDLWGIQGLFRSENVALAEINSLQSRKKSVLSSRIEFFLQYARGKEWLAEGAEPLSAVMNQPRWQTQFRMFFKIGRSFEFMMASNRQTSVLSKSVAYRDQYYLRFTQETYPTFRTWDMSTRLYLNEQFVVYLHFQNVFNRRFAGLDATGTPDDLHYNAQQGRFFRFGANYNLN